MVAKTIDIDKILAGKMGKRARLVPRFLVAWLKRLVHEDQVNQFLDDHSHLEGVEWLEACVKYLDMTLEIEGMENLPDKNNGKLYTFVSNHPLGGEDGVALGAIIGRHYDGRFRYLVNDLLLNLPGLKPLCIGINKTGRQSRNFPAMVEAGFKSDKHMLMFPAGLNSRRQKDGTIHDIDWKKTFIVKSVERQRDVVPIHFSGQNSNRFYRFAQWRKRLGLKLNIEMILLPGEMMKCRGKHFEVIFGSPIPWTSFTDGKPAIEHAARVRECVYNLMKNNL